jgi:hypothetical protein
VKIEFVWSAMSYAAIVKLCACCGADVTHQKRHKDRYGERLCLACYHAGRKSPRAELELNKMCTCVFCGAELIRRDCHQNRYGEYVCAECLEHVRRRSWRRFVGWPWPVWARCLLYTVLGAAGIVLAYFLVGMAINR